MKTCIVSLLSLGLAGAAPAALWVDFNSNQSTGGVPILGDPGNPSTPLKNDPAYFSYHAAHEAIGGFGTATYSTTFAVTGAASVGLTPTWSNTMDNRVQQSIGRGAGNDANYLVTTPYSVNLVTDWIGIDTRTGGGGNGNFDGTNGTPTWIELNLTGLPAAEYNWLSIHHDTENTFANFNVYVDNGSGAGYVLAGSGYQADSSPGGTPDSAIVSSGPIPGPANTFSTTFTADGINPVSIRFEPLSGQLVQPAPISQVHNQFFAVNGFQLDQVPEPSTGLLGLLGLGMLLRRRR